jgi:hypothetical protein
MITTNEDIKLNFYIAKPFQAIQILPETVEDAMKILPDNFVFYGLNRIGVDQFQKEYDDNLKKYQMVGGYFYFNKKTEKIFNGDWIVIRKERFEIVNDDYFKANFIEIPFIMK